MSGLALPPVVRPGVLRSESTKAARVGAALLSVASAAMLALGIWYVLLALTAKLLPNDIAYLGINMAELCTLAGCRIVGFIAHDTAVYGGVMVANATVWAWIAHGPVRRGETWAWWTLLSACVCLLVGVLCFAGYGYLDATHVLLLAPLMLLAATGLILTRPPESPRLDAGAARHLLRTTWSWTETPAGRGRLLLVGLGVSLLFGGASVAAVAATSVFVPQDLGFLGLTAERMQAISPRLLPSIAHDRAEFGAGLMMLGVLFAGTAWNGLRRGAPGPLLVLALAGLVHCVTALVAHGSIGYRDPVHLFPVYAGIAILVAALLLLRRHSFAARRNQLAAHNTTKGEP